MSQRDRDRLVVIRQVGELTLTMAEGARRLGLGPRQMRRVVRRYEVEADHAVIHGLRGRPSNRRLAESVRAAALGKAREPLYRDFGPTLLSEHLARDHKIGWVHPSTLRLWMIAEGLWEPRTRKQKHRRRRERRAARGELVLMDTSIHDWLEKRCEEPMVLIALIDDATSQLTCRFFPRDTGAANRQLLIDYLETHGRMEAVYADRAGHFRVNFRRKERREKDEYEALTLIKRALTALEIELIIAMSPQAKGRVERLFGTLQDRMIKEMRVAGIDSMVAANRFVDEEFIPFWNERFSVAAREPIDAHRPLPDAVDLLRVFAETAQRVIGHDFCFRHQNRFYQIEATEADGAMPKTPITLEQRLDGSLHFRWRDRYLSPTPLDAKPTKTAQTKTKSAPTKPRPLVGAAGKPVPASHPWRRFPVRIGKGRAMSPVPGSSPEA